MVNFPDLEAQVLERWKDDMTEEKHLELRKRAEHRFVFFEGPPTANGRPGIHHVLARAFKDLICRYKTLRGFRVGRKAGWDTHGLPVELEVEKQLGLKSKKDIEAYGVGAFNKKCKESVWTYKDEWEKLTRRMGFWLDLAHPYVTYETGYMESLWWIMKQVWDKGYLYRGHKVVPLCTRCGTGLSSHEVAQGYKSVTESSVYVRFMVKAGQKIGADFTADDKTSILVWTTTPWTLPANVALAVGKDIEYARLTLGGETLFVASARVSVVTGATIAGSVHGGDLVGLSYEPLYEKALKPDVDAGKTAYKVYAADFVSTTDGTGVVHIAPMYGEDDYVLGQTAKLPNLHTVELDGTVRKGLGIPGEGKFAKEADPDITADLKMRGALFAVEPYAHDYPFCWRCSTPLLYYAKPSWFVAMSKLRDELLANNETITWVPEHLKEGRFGEWLREVKDWNFSRERYWGTPLPIWECPTCGERRCVGTVEELDAFAYAKSGNTYTVMRHGEADSNYDNFIASEADDKKFPSHLTPKGKIEAFTATTALKEQKVDLIVASPFARTRETAEIVAGITGAKLVFDERLVELNHGEYHGRTVPEYLAWYEQNGKNRFVDTVPGGETLHDVRRRMMAVVRALEKAHKGKRILLISHGDPIWMLRCAVENLVSEDDCNAMRRDRYLRTAEFSPLPVRQLPYDEDGFLNLHRPYIDDVVLRCPKDGCAGEARRVPEIADVWFDSGSMPFAQWHYLGKPGTPFEAHFPAEYICEGIDQTRGWFYTLLAVSTLLGKGAPFTHAISVAHILDTKGQKMSKSKGNIVSPGDIIAKYGVDALRWYFFTVNEPGEYKLFDERHVAERMRGFLSTWWNCVVFYTTHCAKRAGSSEVARPSNVLDRWVLSRLYELVFKVQVKLDAYDVTAAARALEAFVVDDLSQWYIRRSRDRLQEDLESVGVFNYVLGTVAQLSSPFVPFVADAAWHELGEQKSVHLTNFPELKEVFADEKMVAAMAALRAEVSGALALRAGKGMKVRQPLLYYTTTVTLEAAVGQLAPEDRAAMKALLAEEINVKEVIFGKSEAADFDWTITEELRAEGAARDLARAVQEARKAAGCKPGEPVTLTVGNEEEKKLLEHPVHGVAIMQKGAVKSWTYAKGTPLAVVKA